MTEHESKSAYGFPYGLELPRFAAKLAKRLNCDEVLETKGIKSFLNLMPDELRNSRVWCSHLRRTAAKLCDNDIVVMDDEEQAQDHEDPNHTRGEREASKDKGRAPSKEKKRSFFDTKNIGELITKNIVPSRLLMWDSIFCIIITSKSHVSWIKN